MAFPTNVNDQITDSVSQVNTKVLGDAPAIAMGNLFQATAQALANAAHNATESQQQAYETMQASTTQGISTLLSVDTASAGEATKEIFAAAPPAPPSEPSEAVTEQAIQAAIAAQEAAMRAANQAVQAAMASANAAVQAAMQQAAQALQAAMTQTQAAAQAQAAAAAALAAAAGTLPED
ncbi:RebB family R body protein [Caulobacter radicis]|uniref:RebB family R body protein n=1 Tax=Caulobacter radicis TaxID=2172650 RepID=UPI001AD81B8F|nr:RebB family R body protein [Caulobacter radicis]